MGAAAFLEVKARMPEAERTLLVETLFNLRKLIAQTNPEVQPAIGLYASSIDTIVPVKSTDKLWDLARGYKNTLTHQIEKAQFVRESQFMSVITATRYMCYLQMELWSRVFYGRVKVSVARAFMLLYLGCDKSLTGAV